MVAVLLGREPSTAGHLSPVTCRPAGQEVGSLGAMLFPEVRQEYKLQVRTLFKPPVGCIPGASHVHINPRPLQPKHMASLPSSQFLLLQLSR